MITERIYPDADLLAPFIIGADMEMLLQGPSDGDSRLRLYKQHGVTIQSFRISSPVTSMGSTWDGVVSISFPIAGSRRWLVNGREFRQCFLLNLPGAPLMASTNGPAQFLNIQLPAEQFAARWRRAGHHIHQLKSGQYPLDTQRYRQLVDHCLAMDAWIATGTASEAVVSAWLEAVLTEVVAVAATSRPTTGHAGSRRILARVSRVLDHLLRRRGEGSPKLEELSVAACTTDRSLRYAFESTVGMCPRTYLRARRLNFARRYLRCSVFKGMTVTEAATSMGFFDYGRFASEYRGLFGENPSETLSRRID